MKNKLATMTVFFIFGFYQLFCFAADLAPDGSEVEVFNSYLRIWDQSPITKTALSEKELVTLYQETVKNPVSKLSAVSKYDPDGFIGFCFGRAMTAQLQARKMGLAPQSIQKLFIIGALCSGCTKPEDKPEWRFHVTTLVRGPKNKMYVIDPIYPHNQFKPVSVAQWIHFVRNGWEVYLHGPPKAYLYATDGTAVMPDLTELPNPESGKLIIELNFIPEKANIQRISRRNLKNIYGVISPTEKIYSLSSSDADLYMLTARNIYNQKRFNFLNISINDAKISYNNYFFDLLNFMETRISVALTEASSTISISKSIDPNLPKNLPLGFDLERILNEP